MAHSSHSKIAAASQRNRLERSGVRVLALIAQLKDTASGPDIDTLRQHAAGEVKDFEASALRSGVPDDVTKKARYVLCATFDEAVLNTPWGHESDWDIHSLSSMFKSNVMGGDDFFTILDDLIRDPANNLELLELMYICLSLGFQGRFRILDNGRSRLEEKREQLYGVIHRQRGEFERELSPYWRGLTGAGSKVSNLLPAWLVAAVASVVLALVFLFFRMDLNRQSNPLFNDLNGLTMAAAERDPQLAPPPPLAQPTIVDVCAPLREEAAKGLIEVICEPGKSTILIRDALFDSGADQPNNSNLVRYIGEVINQKTRQEDIKIIGHTDSRGGDAYNYDLSTRRAKNVALLLAGVTGRGDRYQYGGRGETEPKCNNDSAEGRACNRRVEITIFAPTRQQASRS